MNKIASLAFLATALIGSASASIINYSTTGAFVTPSAGASLTATQGTDTATLTYTPIAVGSSFNNALPGTNISYGAFDLTFAGTGTVSFPAFTFNLVVNEPGAGSATIVASSSGGTIGPSASNLNVFYAPTAFTLDSNSFSIFFPTPIVPTSTLGGISTIQGFVVGPNTASPEPGTMILLGAGLLGIGVSARKKFAARS